MKGRAEETVNEATLEARMGEALGKIFPSLGSGNLSYQRTLKLKLGHETISADGFRPRDKTGRLDVVITLSDKPFAVLELKKPGESLGNKVSRQALSYARSIDSPQIPPLVIVSNGDESKFFKTWDGTKWESETVTEETVQRLFSDAGEIAASALDECVSYLLDIDDAIWKDVIGGFTRDTLKGKTGSVRDVLSPIAEDFHIRRSAEMEILTLLENGTRKIALVGEPFSGKTCALGSLSQSAADSPWSFLYLDAADSAEGLVARIGGNFTSKFFKEWSTERTRTWFSTRLQHCGEFKLVVAIDGIDAISQGNYRTDLDFFARLADQGSLVLLIAGHDGVIDQLSSQDGTRVSTVVGRGLVKVNLGHQLSMTEWACVPSLFSKKLRAVFNSSPEHVFELRIPRFLRLLASTVKIPEEHRDNKSAFAVLHPLPQAADFENIWNELTTQQVREDFLALARAFLTQPCETKSSGSIFGRYSFATIDLDHLTASVPESAMQRLVQLGYLRTVFNGDGYRTSIPNPLEFMVIAMATHLSTKFFTTAEEQGVQFAVDQLVEETEEVPYSSTVCAMAVVQIARRNYKKGFQVILHLLEFTPRKSTIGKSSDLQVVGLDDAMREIVLGYLPVEPQTPLYGGFHPWLALADVLGYPMEGESEEIFKFRREVIAKLGSLPIPMIRSHESPWNEPVPFQMHEIAPDVVVLCSEAGHLEPIGKVISIAFKEDFDQMKALAERALKSENIPLVYRLLASLRFLRNTASKTEANRFRTLGKDLGDVFSKFLNEI